MKNQPEVALLKATKKFDKQLLILLSREIKVLKNSKNGFITHLNGSSNNPLLVA